MARNFIRGHFHPQVWVGRSIKWMAKYEAYMAKMARINAWRLAELNETISLFARWAAAGSSINRPASSDNERPANVKETCVITKKFETDSNSTGAADDAGIPAGMHRPTHGPQDAIEMCNTDDALREEALRESSLRVPR